MELNAAREIVQSMIDLLAPDCERIEIGGSIRRGKETVNDGEIVAIPNHVYYPRGTDKQASSTLLTLTDSLVENETVEKALYGDSKTTRWGAKYRGMLYKGLKVELFLADADNFGYQFWLRTGPAEANMWLMKWLSWKQAPVRAKDGYWLHQEHKLTVASEEDQFALLGMPFIAPTERNEIIYRKLLQNNRAHQWPDFSTFYAHEPQNQQFWADEILPAKGRVSGSCKLLNGESFADVRDQMALEHYQARLPILRAEIDRIYAEIAPIWDGLRVHVLQHGYLGGTYNHKHAYEKLYAAMDGRDALYQQLTAEVAAIEADMAKRWKMKPEAEVVEREITRRDEPPGWSRESIHENGFEAMLEVIK